MSHSNCIIVCVLNGSRKDIISDRQNTQKKFIWHFQSNLCHRFLIGLCPPRVQWPKVTINLRFGVSNAFGLLCNSTRNRSQSEKVHSPPLFALTIGRTDSPPRFHSRPQNHRHFLLVICVPTRCCSIGCPAWQRLLLNFHPFPILQLPPAERGFSMSRNFFFSLFSLFVHNTKITSLLYCIFFIRQIDKIFFYTFSSRTTFVLLAWISAWCGIIW